MVMTQGSGSGGVYPHLNCASMISWPDGYNPEQCDMCIGGYTPHVAKLGANFSCTKNC